MATGDVKKDFDVIGSNPPEGCTFLENQGVMPRKGPAEMDGGQSDYKPMDTGNYKGKKDFGGLFSR